MTVQVIFAISEVQAAPPAAAEAHKVRDSINPAISGLPTA